MERHIEIRFVVPDYLALQAYSLVVDCVPKLIGEPEVLECQTDSKSVEAQIVIRENQELRLDLGDIAVGGGFHA